MFPTKSNETISDALKSVSLEAGRQKNGKLWSNLKEVCDLLRIPVSPNSSIASEETLFQHVQFKTGQRIHMIGQPFEMLYVVNSGFLKTVLIDELGNEQILCFPMKSDLLGVDGINSRFYTSEAVALSACDLILIPFKKLTTLGRTYPELENAMYSVMSRELVREQAMISMLGSLSAEGRVARFLVSLSDRFAQMGYSHRIFNLRMPRHEIGSYIGLTLETVSRTLSALHEIGWISVDQKTIEIKDIQALRNLRRLPNAKTRAKDKAKAAKAEKAIMPAVNLNQLTGTEYYESVLRPTA
ncbi:MAG: helix-turn-helix domain-containing protein [Oxalobacter sp.]|nr:helix-turn-helix domain-containing protein [Oxalobacter sp.]